MTLFRFRGIPIRLHLSFLLLAGIYVVFQAVGGGLSAALTAALMGVAVFGSVMLHELGHAMAARTFGIPTRDITLYPFGGIASLTREPATPTQEVVVALAGPAVNGVLAAAGFGAWMLGVEGALIFAIINAGMGLFNLLPAYPMDGGRVLRAWWTPRFGQVRATLRSLDVSRWFGWGFVALGLFTSPNLLLVGGFLLLIHRAERARWRALLPRQQLPTWLDVSRARVAVPARHRSDPAWSHPVA